MTRRLLSSIFITTCLWAIANLSQPQQTPQTTTNLSIATNLWLFQSPASTQQNH